MRPRRLPTAPELTVRPIRPTDKDALLDLFERLSPRSRLRRFLAPKPSLSRRELAYFTEVDHRTHEALVAVDGDGVLHGVARYACGPGRRRSPTSRSRSPTRRRVAASARGWHGCWSTTRARTGSSACRR